MGDLLTTAEFERYVRQHDARQERFFVEHNGALNGIRQENAEIKQLLKDLIQKEASAREDCAADCEARLQTLETTDRASITRAGVIEGWKRNVAWGLGIAISAIAIATFIITLVK